VKKLAKPKTLILLAIILLAISFFRPDFLSDQNEFLKSAVNHELLAILGFVVALTLGKAGDIHVELNRIQDLTGKKFLNTRSAIKKSYKSLIIGFLIAGALVIVKPNLIQNPMLIAVINSIAILIVYFSLAVLYDITATVFKIPPAKEIEIK
jgi:hypothetical protein